MAAAKPSSEVASISVPFGVQDRSSSLFFARLQGVFDRNHSLNARFFASKAERIRRIVRQRADQGDFMRPGAQRQQGSRAFKRLVPKKHEQQLFSGLAHERTMFRHGRDYFRAFRVRAFEHPQGKLQAQHAANGFIHGRHRRLARTDQPRQLCIVVVRHHVDIHASQERFPGRGCGIERHAMIAQFHDGGVIADNQPVEAPPGTQDIPEKIGICGRGNAVQRVEPTHDGGYPGVHGSLVRRQVKLVEAAQRHIGRVVFAP